jgi:hypothetical protein
MTSQVHHNAVWKSVIAAEDPAVAHRFWFTGSGYGP